MTNNACVREGYSMLSHEGAFCYAQHMRLAFIAISQAKLMVLCRTRLTALSETTVRAI